MKLSFIAILVFCVNVFAFCQKEANDSLVVGFQIGNIAPEIKDINPQHQLYRLSELRGHVVLIHFWSSVCAHCKKENPYLVTIYNQYHNKEFNCGNGFEIFSVSIDVKSDDWIKAIARDSMNWKYQICSRMGWKSDVVKTYDFHKTPSTFLIDKNGIIIAKNLWGKPLEDKLKELLKE